MIHIPGQRGVADTFPVRFASKQIQSRRRQSDAHTPLGKHRRGHGHIRFTKFVPELTKIEGVPPLGLFLTASKVRYWTPAIRRVVHSCSPRIR